MRNMPVFAGMALWSMIVIAHSSSAATVANFTGGNGNTMIDQYRGLNGSGEGWAGRWTASSSSSVQHTISPTVISDSPLNDGGNYLYAPTVAGATTGAHTTVVRREYMNYEEVDLSLPHTISFDFRPEVELPAGDSPIDNRYQMFASTASGETTTSPSTTWAIFVAGGGTLANTVTPGNWGFLEGSTSGSSFNAQTFIDTGITMAVGTVYRIKIDVDPTTKSYVGSINDGTNSFTSGTLIFRDQDATTAGQWLHFGRRQQPNTPGLGFSIDNILITVEPPAVPGDFNGDGNVDGADFVAWQNHFPMASGAALTMGDGDGDGDVDGADFVIWQTNFPFTSGSEVSSVPEPWSLVTMVISMLTVPVFARVRR